MLLPEINPFLRYAELQPSVMSSASHSCAYDHRLFYILSGETRLVFSGSAIDIAAGTAVYVRSGTPYYFDRKVKIIVLNFDVSRSHADRKKSLHPCRLDIFDPSRTLEGDVPNELKETLVLPDAFRLEPYFQECIAEYSFPGPVSDAVTSAAVKRILCEMILCEKTGFGEKSALPTRVMMFIKENYDKALSNNDIASHFGYHPYYLNQLFKSNFGTTLHKALLAERIRMAENLLRITDLPVEQVSFEVGFCDRSQFCTVFKNHTGTTPNTYRHRERGR